MPQAVGYRPVQSRKNLDILRSVAVLLVVVSHILLLTNEINTQWFRTCGLGKLGVWLFFTHTSYVLMHSLARQTVVDAGVVKQYFGFLARRVFRIYPLSIICVVVICFLIAPFNQPQSYTRFDLHGLSGYELIANLTLTQNLWKVPDALGALWTLPLEMQMYLLLPILFWVSARGTRAIILIAALSPVLAIVNHFVIGWSTLTYAPCFISGVLMYTLEQHGKRKSREWPAWLMLPLFLLVAQAYMMLCKCDGFDQTIGGWVVCFLVAVILPRFREASSVWLTTVAEHLAKYSYGIYLFHSICLWISLEALSLPTQFSRWLVFLALMPTVAWILFHVVEQPFIKLGGRLADRLRSVDDLEKASAP